MELSNSCGGVSVKKIFSFALAFVFLMLFTRYILQEEKTSETRVVMVGPGYGLEINGGRVLTALHIAEMMPFPIVYEDAGRDIAIITTNHTNMYNLIFAVSEDDFLFAKLAPKPGESGKPYLTDGKVYGVIIGESGGKGLVAALDESIVLILH
jgi:hypothetical protein